MEKIRPFSSGSEFVDWCYSNCDECKISTSYRDTDEFLCHIEEAIIIAYFDDGHVKKNIIDKIGFNDLFLNNCPFKNQVDYKCVNIDVTVFQQLKLF